MRCVVLICASIVIYVNGHQVFEYDRFSGKKSDKSLDGNCTIEVKPCSPHEGSRIDGTCNNYKRPSRGSAGGPYLRLLKPEYGHMGEIRRNKNGKPLPSARLVRTLVQSDGRLTSHTFNRAAAHFIQFIGDDISAINLDFPRNRTGSRKENDFDESKDEPIPVPHDDPYLRVTGIRYMNFSRADTFQEIHCIPKEIPPEQINFQTPLLDLSTIYGVNNTALKKIRAFEHGLLREERRKGRYVPLNETDQNVCFQNKKNDTRNVCYKFGFPVVGNFDLTTTTLTIFFYREHNRIARILHELNPCWKDDRLFKVARRINVATASNIFLYELLPIVIGFKNMVTFGLASEHQDFTNVYDDITDPLVFAEFEIARRYFNTLLDGRIKKYDENYHYSGEFSLSDTLFRQELIEEDTNFEELNRGTFYQSAARLDDIQDPDISEKFYSQTFHAHDRIAEDIQRGRDFGLQGYNSYRRFCGLKETKKFEDLEDVMSPEKASVLMHLYEELDDVDLLVGIMSEDLIPGLFVGPTLFCIIVKQVQVFKYSDRFWFERGKQYQSFTPPQLHEIRKTNMARFACDNAEGIKFIQPHALFDVEQGSTPVPCSHIGGADLSKWKDESCDLQHHKEYHREHYLSQSERGSFMGTHNNVAHVGIERYIH